MKETLIGAAVLAALLAVLVGLIWWLDSAKCHGKWEGSGMKTQWSIDGGCRLQRKDGTWVPSSVIREVSP